MTERTEALGITKAVKLAVFKRDGGRCILCGKTGMPEAHYIARSHGGLGIQENIVTVCRTCHDRLDNTPERKELLEQVKEHLEIWYPGFPDEDRIYRRKI